MKLFLDSNIWLRYLLQDDDLAYLSCSKLMKSVREGRIRPYTSSVVFLEVYWVLTSTYGISRNDTQKDIETLLSVRGLVIVEKTDFRSAFYLHTKTGVKLADCLIATQLPKGVELCTYDREFARIPSLNTVTPEEVTEYPIYTISKRSENRVKRALLARKKGISPRSVDDFLGSFKSDMSVTHQEERTAFEDALSKEKV
jgi:predicted nucleic-acid-binding protein